MAGPTDPAESSATAPAAAGLSPGEVKLLVRLADPEAPPADPAAEAPRLAQILAAAEQHGVMAIVVRKCSARDTAAEALATNAVSPLERYRARLVGAVGRSMLLARQRGIICERFAKAGIDAVVVKGPVFAELLYSNQSDRPFTDIDFLVRPRSLEAANSLMGTLGFTRPQKPWDNSRRDREYKWLMDANQSIMVELHGDLVHDRMLRRRVSFGFDELRQVEAGVANSPAALLMTAIVHAAGGHKFHRLSLLVDVLQAARGLAAEDEEQFVTASGAIGARLEAAVTLHLVGRLFDEPRAVRLASRFGEDWAIRLGRRLISPDAIVAGYADDRAVSWWRRHGFRTLQQFGPARP